MSKYITGECRAEHERIIAGCECGGRPCIRFIAEDEYCYDAVGPVACPDCDPVHLIPCPTCAPHRAKVKELCRHGSMEKTGRKRNDHGALDIEWKCSCGYWQWVYENEELIFDNERPDLTTALDGHEWLVKTMMMDAGLWEGFKCWHFNNCSVMVSHWMGDFMGKPLNFIAHDAMFDILTDGELLCQAVWSWLEQREV